MNRTRTFAGLIIALALTLAACGGGEPPQQAADAISTQAASIAQTSVAQTNAAFPPTFTPEPPTATPTEAPPTPSETPTSEAGDATSTLPPVIGAPPTSTPGGSSGNCTYSASFETETVPDGTQYHFGRPFTKTWRVKNTGTCTWDGNVNLIWVGSETDGQPSQELLGAQGATSIITTNVAPGEYLEISINLVTPSKAGRYRAYFKFRSPNAIFGIGGTGNLWVEIIAYDPDSGPPTPIP